MHCINRMYSVLSFFKQYHFATVHIHKAAQQLLLWGKDDCQLYATIVWTWLKWYFLAKCGLHSNGSVQHDWLMSVYPSRASTITCHPPTPQPSSMAPFHIRQSFIYPSKCSESRLQLTLIPSHGHHSLISTKQCSTVQYSTVLFGTVLCSGLCFSCRLYHYFVDSVYVRW